MIKFTHLHKLVSFVGLFYFPKCTQGQSNSVKQAQNKHPNGKCLITTLTTITQRTTWLCYHKLAFFFLQSSAIAINRSCQRPHHPILRYESNDLPCGPCHLPCNLHNCCIQESIEVFRVEDSKAIHQPSLTILSRYRPDSGAVSQVIFSLHNSTHNL